MNRLADFPVLLTKKNLCRIYGISFWTLRRRIVAGWGKRFEWYQDGGKLKATRESVEADIVRGIETARRRLTLPQEAHNGI